MTPEEYKERMAEYVGEMLLASGMYEILEKDRNHLLVKKIDSEGKKGAKIYVPLISSKICAEGFKKLLWKNACNSIYTSPVIMKDGINYFVKLSYKRQNAKRGKSFKNLRREDVENVIHLRKLEMIIRENFENLIIYYQPDPNKINESIDGYCMNPVELDYSHIKEVDKEHKDYYKYLYSESGESRVFMLPRRIYSIKDKAKFAKVVNEEKYDFLREWLLTIVPFEEPF